jgi:serine/threonine protein kinase
MIQQIQNYKIVSLIGEGGMGDVYLAEHVSIQRKVAIKVLKPELVKNEEIRLRFKNEASMLAHLQHPHIVGLIDYVEQDGGLFLIMEYVEGQGMDELVQAQTAPISIERARKLMIQIVEAFVYAHQNGIVHRDVKPSNILVTAQDQVKVLDFGIAKLVGEGKHHLTKTGTQMGTVYYMSPEQVRGKVLDHRSDIYSLGVTFYELLSGVCPYKSMTTEYEIYDNIVKEPLLDLTQTMGSDYSSMWHVIQKATAKELNDRYQSCEDLLKDLKNGQVEAPKPVEPKKEQVTKLLEPVAEPIKKKKTWLVVLTLIVIGAVSISMWLLSGSDPAEEGERLAAAYCECQKQNNEEYLTRLDDFVQNFDSKGFKFSSDAEKELNQFTNEYTANTLNTSIITCYQMAREEKERKIQEYGVNTSEGIAFSKAYDAFILKNVDLQSQEKRIEGLQKSASEKITSMVYSNPEQLRERTKTILTKLNNYYEAFSGGYFNAFDYFASFVEQYLTKKNMSPTEINDIYSIDSDWQEPIFRIYTDKLNLVQIENGIETWEYLAEFQCYRPSKDKYQISEVLYQVKFEQSGKMTSYKELNVKNTKFKTAEEMGYDTGNDEGWF